MQTLTITQADDWHLHLRNGNMLQNVIAHSAKQFQRAMIMPNLQPPITSVELALEYHAQILQSLPSNSSFEPLMSLYLTAETPITEVAKVAACNATQAFKLYPAGATTNSAAGVKNLTSIYPLLAAMQQQQVPLLIHGEVTDPKTDIFDRERLFIEQDLIPIVAEFPELKIVLEHITTTEAVQFVESMPDNIGATITPQHLHFNRNALFVGGIQPHNYCLPILKRESHRQSLIKAAISGNPKFFLGTDSAPHLQTNKENACGCAGCYSAPVAIELYAEIFSQEHALDKLEGFASWYGADFYNLPRNKTSMTLQQQTWTIPESYPVSSQGNLIPLKAGASLNWKLIEPVK